MGRIEKIVKTKILRSFTVVLSFLIFLFLLYMPCFAERYKIFATVSMIIEQENNSKNEILLQKRKDTGWMDGFWELAACGHVEKGETLKQAAVRETKEELCLDVKEEDLEFVGLNYNNIEGKGVYCCVYFKVKKFSGTPTIGEPEKCEAIKWFPTKDLPQNIIPIRKMAIENYLNNILYDECNWQREPA